LDVLVASAAPTSPEDAARLRAFAERIETEKRAATSTAREDRRRREALGIFTAYPIPGEKR